MRFLKVKALILAAALLVPAVAYAATHAGVFDCPCPFCSGK